MKFLLFTFLIIALGQIGFSSAVQLSGSPSALEFYSEVGEEQCLIFNVYSDNYEEDLISVMKWSDKDAEVTNPNQLTLDSGDINLQIVYSPETIESFDGEEEVEVCITGTEVGTWKGSLEYRTSDGNNIGVGVGTWLRVYVSEPAPEQTETPSSSSGSSSSGSSGGGSFTVNTNVTNNTEENQTEFQVLSSETTQENEEEIENSGLTGAVVGDSGGKSNWSKLAISLAGVLVLAFILAYRRKKF